MPPVFKDMVEVEFLDEAMVVVEVPYEVVVGVKFHLPPWQT
jgi:hypothetical protein